MKRIVIKIGTNVLMKNNELPDFEVMQNIVDDVVELKNKNIDICIVSSGAVGFGRSVFKKNKKEFVSNNKVSQKQAYASVGQVHLIKTYFDLFAKQDVFCAQVLATREDFRSRKHFLNMRGCIEALLVNNIVPIINENDTVAIDELMMMFAENDELAGLTAAMINADMLIILSNVNGLFDGDPDDPRSKVVSEIKPDENLKKYIADKKSSLGRGGMEIKCKIAQKISKVGVEVVLANGKKKGILRSIFNDDFVGTRFLATKDISAIKKWIAVSRGIEKGFVVMNDGAKKAIRNGASILPVGIVKIEGNFKKNDVIEIRDEKGKNFALGIAKYGAEKAKNALGKKGEKPLVHCDFIFLN